MAVILDTNALSALAALDNALIALIDDAPCVYVSLISLGEYEFGILDSSKKAKLEQWLVFALERIDVLYPDRATLPHYAHIRSQLKTAGTPIPANDVWIAAAARQHRLPIVSQDAHFDRVKGIERIAWR